MSNICVLHYDGVVTGSKELRTYNEHVVSKMYTNTGPMTKVMNYFENYDNTPGGKKKEPFFDGFLVHMALLNKGSYENYGLKNINYWPIQTQDIEVDNTGKKVDNTGENSTFRSTRINESGNDTATTDIENYDEATHIFILAPLTPKVLEILIERINYAKDNPENTLIFHIQGDVIKAPDETPRYDRKNPDSGMTGGGSMFGEAFNLFSGGMEFQTFRNKLKEVDAKFYSVSPKPKEPADEFHARYTKWEESDKTSVPPIPLYYKNVNDDIIKVCSNNVPTDWSNNFRKLNINMIIQDGTDKDNLSAMSFLGNMLEPNQKKLEVKNQLNGNLPNTKSIQQRTPGINKVTRPRMKIRPPVYFVGARMYRSSSVPFGGPNDPKTTLVIPNKSEFRVNPNTQECEKPDDKRNKEKNQEVYGNFEFLKDITVSFYKHQMNGFKECLDDVMPPGKSIDSIFNFIEGGIVDGTGPISLSLRAPFNMSLFFFAPNTYMSSFNPWPKFLKAQQSPQEKAQQSPQESSIEANLGGSRHKRLKNKHNNKTNRRRLKNKTKRKKKT